MSAASHSVALLAPAPEREVSGLAQELLARGHLPRVITSHSGPPRRSVERGVPVALHWRPPEPWTLRNVEPGLSHLPFAYASLRSDAPAIAHAFHPNDSLAALRWSREGGGPTVLTCTSVLTREGIASKRLRLRILERAVYGAGAVTATSGGVRDSLWRWLGVEADVVDTADAYVAIYERLLKPAG